MIKKVLFGMIFILAGCSKPGSNNAYESLKKGKWVITGCTVNPPVNGKDSNVFLMYPECMKDDTFEFRDNGKLVRHNAFTACTPKEQTLIYSVWKEKDEKSFYIDSALTTIKSVSDREVILESKQDINSVRHSFTATYSNRMK